MIATIISIRRIWAILKKEALELWRDKITLMMIAAFPIAQLLLFGFAIDINPKHLPTAISSQDHSILARNIIAGLKNSEYFSIVHEANSIEEIQSLLKRGKIIFGVIIPGNFSRDLVRGTKPQMLIEADATDPVAVGSALKALNGIMQRIMQRDIAGMLTPPELQKQSSHEVVLHLMYNPEEFSCYDTVPGLIGIVLSMTGMILTALSLTREHERGTMENLMSMPVSPFEIMIGKVSPYIIISYIQSTAILLAAYYLFNIPILGSLILLAFGLLLFIFCNLALGFTISSISRNQMQAMQISIFLLLPSVLLSGFMFPFQGMPLWARMIGGALPCTYFIRITRGIMLKGAGIVELWPDIWPLLIFILVISAIAVGAYKRTLD